VSEMKLVYIAGPFSGSTKEAVAANVAMAASFRLPIAMASGSPVCPHTMTSDLDGTMTYEFWIASTLSLLERCDAILMTPDWSRSSGARGEHGFALDNCLPVFYADRYGCLPEDLREWLKEENR
jgi:nucleoside 2-deoxyribosyltransferase